MPSKFQSFFSDAITVRENTSEETTPEDLVDKASISHVTHEFNSSCADSGHFEDCTSSSVHSKDSILFDEHRSVSCQFNLINPLSCLKNNILYIRFTFLMIFLQFNLLFKKEERTIF